MFYARLHCTFVGIVATLVDSIVVAEFAGHWLNRLLHSGRIPALRRGQLTQAKCTDYPAIEPELFSLHCCSKSLFEKNGRK